jgi:hypothetical protein
VEHQTIAPDCSHRTGTSTSTSTGTGTQRARTAPPARGLAAAAQEGHSTGTDTGSNNSSCTVRGTSRNAMVCMARTIRYASPMSVRRILDYGGNPTLRRPPPQPIPAVLETVTSGTAILTIDRFVTMVLPINTGQFNDLLEEHITSGLVPMVYMGSLDPIDDDFWLLLHPTPSRARSYLCRYHLPRK